MKMSFVREVSTRRDETVVPVCVVSVVPGDPSEPLPPVVRALSVRSLLVPSTRPRSRSGEDRDDVASTELRIDTFRFTSGLGLDLLPDPAGRSVRLKETLSALLRHLPALHLLLITGSGGVDISDDEVLAQLRMAMEEHPGALVLFPDLGGATDLRDFAPDARRPGPMLAAMNDRILRWEKVLSSLGPMFRECFQVGLIDAPQLTPEALAHWCMAPEWRGQPEVEPILAWERAYGDQLETTLNRLANVDATVFAWEGAWDGAMKHGWRSPAAMGAQALANQEVPTAMALLDSRTTPLPPPREFTFSRQHRLLPRHPKHVRLAEHVRRLLVPVQIDASRQECQFRGQACLRAPLGFWPLPAVRTLKEIELCLRRTAEAYLFRPTRLGEALKLAQALDYGLSPYTGAGILAPINDKTPIILAQPGAGEGPSLVARIEGTLRPWSQRFRVRLNVRPDGVALEVS